MGSAETTNAFEVLSNEGIIKIPQRNDQFSIGTVSHGENLRRAIKDGRLAPFLNELSSLYRGVYGGEPWQEYLFCTDCNAKKPIPHGVSLQEADDQFSKNRDTLCCSECGGKMDFFYEPADTVNQLQQLFQRDVCAGLLFSKDTNEMLGFSIGAFTTADKGYQDKLVIGEGDKKSTRVTITFVEYLREFEEIMGTQVCKDDRIFNIADWGIAPKAQGKRTSSPLMHALGTSAYEAASSQDTLATGHTLVNSDPYRLLIKYGFLMGKPAPGSEEVQFYTSPKRVMDKTYIL